MTDRKKQMIALLAILTLFSAVTAWGYHTGVPVMDYMPQSEWESVSFYQITEASVLAPGVFTDPRSGFMIWYQYPYRYEDMRIGFHIDARRNIAPEEIRGVLEKYRLWYVDGAFFEPEYLFVISPGHRMWLLGVSRGEYLILLPKGEETIFRFRDDGSLYRALMGLVEQPE